VRTNIHGHDVGAIFQQIRAVLNACASLEQLEQRPQQHKQQDDQQLPKTSSDCSPWDMATRHPSLKSVVDVLSVFQQPCRSPTALHNVLAWPYIYTNIINSGIIPSSDLQSILQEGGVRFIEDDILKYSIPLSCVVGSSGSIDDAEKTENGHLCSVYLATLAPQQVQKYCDAYFNTFNLLYPLMDQEAFMNNVVAKSLREDHTDGDLGSILALLVFALGQVAIESMFDWPVSVADGRLSGFCDDLFSHPPGLGLFNEAR
jgi:hypothetical protein